MTHDEIITVVQAHKEGKQIQCNHRRRDSWDDTDPPLWNFGFNDYRVKPEQKEFWHVRDDLAEEWFVLDGNCSEAVLQHDWKYVQRVREVLEGDQE